MKVENVKFHTQTLDKKNKLYSILKENNVDLWHMDKNSLSFDLIDSNEAFANALRRTFNDELEVYALYVHPSNMDSDDKFILPDNILERINLIPIVQSNVKDLVLSIKITNLSDDILNIYSNDIKINTKKGMVSSEKLFNQNIQICSLRSGKYLYVNNIVAKSKEGYINNTHTLGTHRYECINTDLTIPSLDNTLKDFRIEFCDNGNSDPKEMAQLVYNNLSKRVNKVKSLISAYEIPTNVDAITLHNDTTNNDLYIIQNTKIIDLHSSNPNVLNKDTRVNCDNLYEIHVKNEYHTIGNIITKYVYTECKDIELISYKLDHILKHKIIVNIKHSEYKKIIDNALSNFLKDLKYWNDSIQNFS